MMTPLTRLRTRLRAFYREDAGTSVVTFSLLFPIVLIAFFTTATILEIMVVKSSLYSGVYDATQYLTYQGRNYSPGQWAAGGPAERDARRTVVARMAPDNFLTRLFAVQREDVVVEITPPAVDVKARCETARAGSELLSAEDISFRVTAGLALSPLTWVPFVGRLGEFRVVERATAHVECPRGWNPTPPRERCIFPGFCP